MKERELTGNEMFKMVQEECERILGKVKGKWKKRQKGVLYGRSVNGKWGWYGYGDEEKDGKYVGEIVNRKPNGTGTIIYPDGEKYLGEWKNGKKHGQGTYTYPKGSKYVGEWKFGIRHGQGTWTSPNGKKYVGEYKDGQYWEGIMYDKNGNILMKFVNGVPQK
jgi:hypothetical protein